MIQKIIKIDQEKCNACGLCVSACHEGAIGIRDGKALLLQELACDGVGNCLPVCPTGAISLEERKPEEAGPIAQKDPVPTKGLNQWPIQIKLAPVQGPYFENAQLLIAADCCAYRHPNFHGEFMSHKITLIGCPKLDNVDYSEKLTSIIAGNTIKSLTVARMEVPCCGGIEWAITRALTKAGKSLPLQIVTLAIDGRVQEVR